MESQAVSRRPLPPIPARAAAAAAPRTAFSPQRFRPTSIGGSGARLPTLVASAVTTQREAGATYTVATPLARVSVDSLQYESGVLGAITERTRPAVGEERPNGALTPMEYLTNVLSSRVYDVAIESPLQLAPKLSERLGVNLWLKREDLQPVMIAIPSVAAGKRMPSLFPFGYYCLFKWNFKPFLSSKNVWCCSVWFLFSSLYLHLHFLASLLLLWQMWIATLS